MLSSSTRVSEPTSSSPSMNITRLTGQLVAEDADGAEVGGDAGLVVGGTAAVEPVAALGGLPRRGVPVGVVVLRLHVVVGVEQHRGRALGAGLLGDDGGRGAVVRPDDLGLEALGGEEVARGLGAALDLAGAGRVGADGLDADQVLEVLADAGEHLGEAGADVDRHGPHPSRTHRPRGQAQPSCAALQGVVPLDVGEAEAAVDPDRVAVGVGGDHQHLDAVRRERVLAGRVHHGGGQALAAVVGVRLDALVAGDAGVGDEDGGRADEVVADERAVPPAEAARDETPAPGRSCDGRRS